MLAFSFDARTNTALYWSKLSAFHEVQWLHFTDEVWRMPLPFAWTQKNFEQKWPILNQKLTNAAQTPSWWEGNTPSLHPTPRLLEPRTLGARTPFTKSQIRHCRLDDDYGFRLRQQAVVMHGDWLMDDAECIFTAWCHSLILSLTLLDPHTLFTWSRSDRSARPPATTALCWQG